jgi:hypothetical protein
VKVPWCPDCIHYANHGGNVHGTPPWPTCRFDAKPETCGRFRDHGRPAYSWQSASEKTRRKAALARAENRHD